MNSSIQTQFDTITSTINLFKVQLNTLSQELKLLEKNVKKEIKTMKKQEKKNKKGGNKNPSGFAKPSKVTDELCVFMNEKEGSEIARTSVTKALIEYIEKHNLQNSENKQIIDPDEKLKILLGINEGEKVTYFTLQKFMNKHFIKPINTSSISEL
jgi:chromatin remodeling complex protein RSC6